MFKRNHISTRVARVHVEQMEKDESEVSLIVLSCEVNPLTPDLASEVHDFLRATLYTMSGAEVNSLLERAKFALAIPPQAVSIRMAPDQVRESFTIKEAKIANIHAKRSKKSTAWTLGFNVICSPASNAQLAQIVDCYLKTRYMTFAPAGPGLFDETPTVTSRGLSSVEVSIEDEGDDSIDGDEMRH